MSDELTDSTSPYLPAAEIEAPLLAQVAEAPQSAPLPGPSWLTAIGWMLAFLVGQLVFVVPMAMGLALVLMLTGTPPDELMPAISVWTVPMATLGNLLSAFVLAGIKYRTDAPRALGLRLPSVAQAFLVVMLAAPLFVCASVIGSIVERLLPPMFDIQAEAIKQMASGMWLSLIIGGCLFPAVGEEVFFRGFLGRGLVARYGVIGGTALTSFYFGLFHLSPPQIAGTFVLGWGIHVVYLASKSLPAAMLLHFLINTLGLTMTRLWELSGDDPFASGEEFESFPILVVIGAVVSLGFLGVALYRLRTRWELADGTAWQPSYPTAETPPIPAVAVRDAIRQHGGLLAVASLAWIGFAIALATSGAFSP